MRKVVMVTAIGLVFLTSAYVLMRAPAEASLWRFLGMGLHEAFTCPQDAVVVLGGGYYPAQNRLNGESALRVLKGVEVFKTCGAQWLVMSGRTKLLHRERQVKLMRDLAMESGVPPERILLEPDSRNTREHPLNVKTMASFDAQTRLAVVTSPWHLRRAMLEFKRYFPKAVPVASYSFAPELSGVLLTWLPQLKPLDGDTMLHEYCGILWYGMLHWYSMLIK